MARLGGHLRQWMCGLHGHDELLHFEQGRISLQCVSCGYQSPGWEVKQGNGSQGRVTHGQATSGPVTQNPAAADAATAAPVRRARILRLPLVNHRHVA